MLHIRASLTNKKIDGAKGFDVEGNKVTPTTDAAFGQKGVQTVLRRQNPDHNEKDQKQNHVYYPGEQLNPRHHPERPQIHSHDQEEIRHAHERGLPAGGRSTWVQC